MSPERREHRTWRDEWPQLWKKIALILPVPGVGNLRLQLQPTFPARSVIGNVFFDTVLGVGEGYFFKAPKDLDFPTRSRLVHGGRSLPSTSVRPHASR